MAHMNEQILEKYMLALAAGGQAENNGRGERI